MAKDDKSEKLKERCLKYIESCKTAMEADQLQNAEKMKRYQREPYGNEAKGRSQVVMSDVADTIEWIMPSLMRIFYGSEDVVALTPQGPDDEKKAKLMEEKINYDFQKGMNGFGILHDFFKDALLQKKGIIKYRWEKKTEFRNKEYSGISDMEFSALLENPDIIILEHSQEGPVHNVKVREVIRISRPIMENLPSEEFVYLPTAKSLRDTDFVAHKKRVHKSELKKYKFSEEDVDEEIKAFEDDPAYLERFNDLGGIDFITPNKEEEYVWIYECYVNEYDKEGNRIPKKVTIIGNKVIDKEDNPYGRPPFCVCSPIRMPHRMVGMDIAELVMEIQKLRTALVRYVMDNIYFQNNGMKVVNPFKINVDQLLNNNVPGGIALTLLDTNPNDSIYPVPIAPLPPHIMAIMEYIETMKENRTGITKYNQGLDSKSLNRTASGISQIMGAAQQRVEMIARVFAESEDGVKGMFQALVDLNLMFFDRIQNIKINNGWRTIGPLDISGMYDIIIDIGTGTGSKEIKFNQLSMMFDKYAMAAPALPDMITKQNLYNLISAMWENLGFKNTSAFITETKLDPSGPAIEPPQPEQPQPQGAPPEIGMPPQGMPQGVPMPQGPPMQGPPPEMMGPPQGGLPMPMPQQMLQSMPPHMQDMSPFEQGLMSPPPPMPPQPGVVVNMAPVNVAPPSVNIAPTSVTVNVPEQPTVMTKLMTPKYDKDGKIVSIESKTMEMVE
jgi:hypothetical protein